MHTREKNQHNKPGEVGNRGFATPSEAQAATGVAVR
jgi:hypothetical protein